MSGATTSRPRTAGDAAGAGALSSLKIVRVLNRGGWANGDVFLCEGPDGRCVVKSYHDRALWLRATLGRWLIRRERAALARLHDLAGIAVLRNLATDDALAVDAVDGDPISFRITEKNVKTIHGRLRTLVEEMHSRGVYHLDLRNRGNVLVDPADNPTVLDFASSVLVRPDGFLARLFRPALAWWDHRGVEKWSTADAAQTKPDDWDSRI